MQIFPDKCIDFYILKERENVYLMEFGGIATDVLSTFVLKCIIKLRNN